MVDFINNYIMEIAVVLLAILNIVQIIHARQLSRLLLKQQNNQQK